MSGIKRYIETVVKDSLTLRKAAKEESIAIQKILTELLTEWQGLIAVAEWHGNWFVNKTNAATNLAALISKVGELIRILTPLRRLRKAGTEKLTKMAALSELLVVRLTTFKKELVGGEVTSKELALQKIGELPTFFNESKKLALRELEEKLKALV